MQNSAAVKFTHEWLTIATMLCPSEFSDNEGAARYAAGKIRQFTFEPTGVGRSAGLERSDAYRRELVRLKREYRDGATSKRVAA